MSTYKGFTSIELKKPTRSMFDLSHEKRLSTRMGKLTPIFMSEAMPNDTFILNSEVMLRLAPLIAPIMHRVNVYVHFFFVPNRLLWEDFPDFISGGRLGTETPPVPPSTSLGNIAEASANLLASGTLGDYLGIPNLTDVDLGSYDPGITLDLMPFAAYHKVWQDYYRDRNYTADTDDLPLASGFDSDAARITRLMSIKNRCWEHEYFSSTLPFTQRGDEVLMPISARGGQVVLASTGLPPVTSSATIGYDNTGQLINTTPVDIELEMSSSEVSINDLRRAVALQQWMERNAVAGSRYNETILAHFARKTSDARLQRAEYLGGGKVAVKISEVVTTAFSQDSEAATVPPASMSGHGISFGNTNKVSYNCEEWGFVIGIMSVMPTSAYMQGLPRMFVRRNTVLDYPWPSFAHLGEQEVYTNELYMDPTTMALNRDEDDVFGYQSRYADWKYIPSSSHGDFRSSLDMWHLTRKFSSVPQLGETFVTFEDALQDRVFAVSGVDTLWCYIYNQCNVKRSLPYFGTPRLG